MKDSIKPKEWCVPVTLTTEGWISVYAKDEEEARIVASQIKKVKPKTINESSTRLRVKYEELREIK